MDMGKELICNEWKANEKKGRNGRDGFGHGV